MRSEGVGLHFNRMSLFQVIHEDDDLLVINKPAGLVCHPTKTDELSSLVSRVRLYLGPGGQPQLLNRLDRETSGVTLVARTNEVAREIRRLWENRQVRKEYLALVHGHVVNDTGLIDAPLGKDTASRVAIKDCVRPDGSTAQTEYSVELRFSARRTDPSLASIWAQGFRVFPLEPTELAPDTQAPFTLLRIVAHTGRKHQIRIHLAHMGHPIVGDKLYGGNEDLYLALVENRLTEEDRRRLILPNHALHASLVRFTWRGVVRTFTAKTGT